MSDNAFLASLPIITFSFPVIVFAVAGLNTLAPVVTESVSPVKSE